MALLSINRLPLPVEIISTIKDFAFISFERKRIMENHSIIHHIVLKHADLFDDDSFYNDLYQNRDWFFSTDKLNKNRRGIIFCKFCGDFLPRCYPRSYRGNPPICFC